MIRCILGIMVFLFAQTVHAHPVLSTYVHHSIEFDAKDRYVDLTIQLTFQDRLAREKFAQADLNGDMQLSVDERTAYGALVLTQVHDMVRLECDDKVVELLALYPPQIVFNDDTQAMQHGETFEISIYLFASTDPYVRKGRMFKVSEHLVPDSPALVRFHVKEQKEHGLRLQSKTKNMIVPKDRIQPVKWSILVEPPIHNDLPIRKLKEE